ncbi:MAG: hypothetical protein NVSMB9_12080 [Isosphaeraceae bacterium]
MKLRIFGPGVMVSLVMSWPTGIVKASDGAPSLSRLRAHVATLASAEFAGRRGVGGEKAADYLIEQFKLLKLQPLFDDSFSQCIPGGKDRLPGGRNVGALMRGSDPTLREEWVIVSAHFDHLGTRGTSYYPGADDNASGVAMMLEVARAFVESDEKPRRSLAFIGFDLEEVGLFGSRYYVEHSPVPLSRIALFITADMIGRSLGGVCDPYVFVMGTEHSPETRPWIENSRRGMPLNVGLLGTDLLLINRSDYGPFRARKVPYLFFSTGESDVYHSTRDRAETLNYSKLERITRLIIGVSQEAVLAEEKPNWKEIPDHPLAEAVTLHDVMRALLLHRESLKINTGQALLMKNTLRSLDEIIARGTMSAEERTSVVRVARVILFSLF